jgi:hypothetical protein
LLLLDRETIINPTAMHRPTPLTLVEIPLESRIMEAVKKFLALLFALISGIYLLTLGIWVGPPDFIPFIDEATALIIFVKAMGVLGVDLTRLVPFLGRKEKTPPKPPGQVVDV